MSAHCNVLCYAFISVFCSFYWEGSGSFLFYIDISLTEVKICKKKKKQPSFYKEKKSLVMVKPPLLCIKRLKA